MNKTTWRESIHSEKIVLAAREHDVMLAANTWHYHLNHILILLTSLKILINIKLSLICIKLHVIIYSFIVYINNQWYICITI